MLLNEMLSRSRIMLDVEALDWEEAINTGGSLLLNEGLIEERYIEKIKSTKKTLGPYIVIAPGIAISHSKPEDGVLGMAMSLIRLKEPVKFGHKTNDPVKLIFTLASTDKKSHLKALRQLMNVFLNKEDMGVLFLTEDVCEIAEVIDRYSKI